LFSNVPIGTLEGGAGFGLRTRYVVYSGIWSLKAGEKLDGFGIDH